MKRLAVTGAIVCLACVRPGARTIEPVAEERLEAPVATTWSAAVGAVSDQGLPIRYTDRDGRVIETDYVNIVTYRPEVSQYPVAERLVRFRLFVAAGPDGVGSRLAIQGIYRPFATGLENTQRDERAIPRDHPAMHVVRDIVERVRELAEGG